jgi:site-specific recombinase XerD
MRRAPYSPDFRAPDSALQGAWAPDSDGRLTPDRGLEAANGDPRAAVDSASGATLARAIRLYLEAKTAEGLSPRSIEWYSMVLERVARDFGPDREVDAISPAELRAWLVTLRGTLSPGSVLGYYRAAKAFGNWLAREGLSAAAAFLALRRPKTPARVIEPIPDDDLRRLLAAASVRDRALILLLLDTGLRVSEAAGISLGDLRPDGSIKVMGKGARERIVPVGPTARSALVRYLAERAAGGREEGLFLGREGQLTTRGIHQLLGRLKRRTGVQARCNPHALRHTFAHAYLVNGGDLFSLQRILGHSTLDMVRRYVALADSDVALRHQVASPADRLLGAPGRARPADVSTSSPQPAPAPDTGPSRSGRALARALSGGSPRRAVGGRHRAGEGTRSTPPSGQPPSEPRQPAVAPGSKESLRPRQSDGPALLRSVGSSVRWTR